MKNNFRNNLEQYITFLEDQAEQLKASAGYIEKNSEGREREKWKIVAETKAEAYKKIADHLKDELLEKG